MPVQELTLDPADWSAVRALGHRMLDDMFDHLSSIRERPAWREIPAVTPSVVEDPRDPNENQPRLILTGSNAELRRFLVNARMNNKTWFPPVAPALRVKAKQ